ncbi:MAG: hypothetical protein HNEKOMLI_00926 [Sodalis sp. Psp]|nr:hypothetical protein [Sodalis sp. Psp]MCR3757383.1 hypothetical protein [Sodalis sp. Ppy]
MSYNEWVEITVTPLNVELRIQGVRAKWGKFYLDGDKDKEIPGDSLNGLSLKPNMPHTVYACGRKGAAAGTEGEFYLLDQNVKVAKYNWSDPWGSGPVESILDCNRKLNYFFRFKQFENNTASSPIGKIFVDIFKAKVDP